MFTKLFHQQADGSVTTNLISENLLAEQWTGTVPFNSVLEQSTDARLLRVSSKRIGDEEERRVSLGHDSVAKLAASWKSEIDKAEEERKAEIDRAEKDRKSRRRLQWISVLAAVFVGLAVIALYAVN